MEDTRATLKFLPICEGNRLAAIILDYLYTFSLIFDRVERHEPFRVNVLRYGLDYDDYYYSNEAFAKFLHYDEVNMDGELEYDNFEDFRSKLITIAYEAKDATNVQLAEAIDFLCSKKHFISLSYLVEDWVKEGCFNLYCSSSARKHIDQALSRLQEVIHVPPSPLPLFDKIRERKIVLAQNGRAAKSGQPAILTLDEWLSTLEYYKGRCAFNPAHPYEVLEHFYPLSGSINGTGTSVFNCIPACVRCNVSKGDRHPTDILSGPLKDAIPSIQAYLDKRREHWLTQLH